MDAAAWIARYADRHADIVRGAVPVEQRRFLVWSCRPMGVCGGLGNRIVNIVAAFALAILTDRAFLIDYPGSSPLELEAFARSDLIDWRMPTWFEHTPFSEGSAVVGIMLAEPISTAPIVEERRAFNRKVRAVQIHTGIACPDETMWVMWLWKTWLTLILVTTHQANFLNYTEDVLWVISSSDLYLLDVLQNPQLREQVCRYSLTGIDHVYALLGKHHHRHLDAADAADAAPCTQLTPERYPVASEDAVPAARPRC